MHKDMLLRESLVKSTKILAGKNVKVLMEGFAPRVVFDPKTKAPVEIILPMIPDDCPKDLVDAIKGYQDHEVYHILYSSSDDICDEKEDELWHYMHNVIDDNHINAKGAKDFPGTHIELVNAYKYLFENMDTYKADHIKKMFASDKKQAIAGYIVSWVARKMNSDFVSPWYDSSPLPELFKELDDKLPKKLEDKLRDCSSPEEVRELTNDMLAFLDEYKKELKKVAAASAKSSGKSSGRGDGDKDGKDKDKGEKAEGTGEEETDYDEDRKPIDIEDLPSSFEDGMRDVIGKNIKVHFERTSGTFFWSERMNELLTVDNYKGNGRGSGGIKSASGLDNFDMSCKQVSSYLRKRLERLLESRQRVYYTGGYKSGKLHGKNLFSVPLGNVHVFSKKNEIRALNAAVGLLIDLSGSMNGSKVKLAAQSTYALADCLEKLKIPFEALGFWTDQGSTVNLASLEKAWKAFESSNRPDVISRVVNQKSVNSTFVFKSFEEPFGLRQKTALLAASQGKIGMYQNEDSTHLKIALERLAKQPQEKKVLFVFSDGCPAFYGPVDNSRSKLVELAENAKRDYGVTVVGIGIQCHDVSAFYKNDKVINNLEELPTTVFEILTAQLLDRK